MAPKSNKPKAPSQRQLRVGEAVRHAITDVLSRGNIHDDVISRTVITVPEARMTPDLKLATVYVLSIGGDNIDAVVKALNDNKKFIRREIARAIQLKYAPDLLFREDETFDEATRIDELLASPKVRRDIEQP